MSMRSMRRSRQGLAAAVIAVLLIGGTPAQADLTNSRHRRVTITFSYRLDAAGADSTGSQTSCALRLPRRADGIEVLRAAVRADCIRSFRTVTRYGRELLHCINRTCAEATRSPGVVPDTRWQVAWTGGNDSYRRSGLEGYAASAGDWFGCELVLVN